MASEKTHKRKKYKRTNVSTKYVCRVEDLDRPLNDDLKGKFQALFPNPSTEDKRAWRMYYRNSIPQKHLSRFGIDFDNPTVRDAVAFDLVKLDDSSLDSIGYVSNDREYACKEHVKYSPMEYERYLLNRNFRINLVNLDSEWSRISYVGRGGENGDNPVIKSKRTVERMYQGVAVSTTMMKFFRALLNKPAPITEEEKGQFSIDDVYVPFTNANYFTTEISLVPNTHPDFRPITTRAYYDMKYAKYRKTLRKYHITAISTFALVDPDRDKNHTGEFLVKVQRETRTTYNYVVLKMNKDGQLGKNPNGTPAVVRFDSVNNTILCVCRGDFCQFDEEGNMLNQDREVPTSPCGEWTPEIRDIPMVKSTTSSHYSIFRQRIPEYELKQVRHYLQFKNRLEGMELCLEQLKRNVHMKEVQASYCFAKQTMALWRLFQQFSRNKELMALVMQYYDLIAEYDGLVVKRTQLEGIRDEKISIIQDLTDEYNQMEYSQLDRKLQLGDKIKSIKLEVNMNISSSIESINERLDEIQNVCVKEINDKIDDIQNSGMSPERVQEIISNFKDKFNEENIENAKDELQKRLRTLVKPSMLDSSVSDFINSTNAGISSDLSNLINGSADSSVDSTTGSLWWNYHEHLDGQKRDGELDVEKEHPAGPLRKIDTKTLHHYILQSERWRGFLLALGYELNQMKKMQTICEDATIKVRRLVHNFKEKMENVEADVWDENHALRNDFSFTGITSAGLREIILLHDWYACNAPGKTYAEMGFKDADEFMQFRMRCNKIAYNLRKNQYAQMIAMQKVRIQDMINTLTDKIQDRKTLKFNDRYGKDGRAEDDSEWKVDDVSKASVDRVGQLAKAEDAGSSDYDREEVANRAEEARAKHREQKGRTQIVVDAERFLAQQMLFDIEDIHSRALEGKAKHRQKDSSLKEFVDNDVPLAFDQEAVRSNASEGRKKFISGLLRAKGISSGWDDAVDRERFVRQYQDDISNMVERTVGYLKGIGLIQNDADLENLVVRNKAMDYKGDVYGEIQKLAELRRKLDESTENMTRQRDAMKSIMDSIYALEVKMRDLKQQSQNLFNACVSERNKRTRNRLLMDKMDVEQKAVELKQMVKKTKSEHAADFMKLETMRRHVDQNQCKYDEKVAEFKERIGVNQDAFNRILIGIYNKWQDEILAGGK